jgi:hypothetical protein
MAQRGFPDLGFLCECSLCICLCVCVCVYVYVCGGRFGLCDFFGRTRQVFWGFLGFVCVDFDFVGLGTWVRALKGPGAPLAWSLGFNPSALAWCKSGW